MKREWTGRYVGVRWREDVGFELRCERCSVINGGPCYWPLDLEFWNPKAGLRLCRACQSSLDRDRLRAKRAADPDAARKRDRARYRANRRWILVKRAAYYEANRDEIRAKANARYQARKEQAA